MKPQNNKMLEIIKPGEDPFLPGRVSEDCLTAKLIKCPYYRALGEREIRCKGITDTTQLAIRFRRQHERTDHEKLFCRDRYWCCEICRMLDMIDEEDE